MKKSEVNLELRILKSGTCKSISGRSTLTYHIGCTPDSEIFIRVFSNLSSGNFSKEWIPLKGIQEALRKQHKGSPITAYLLQPLYRAKSVNTPAFLLSALAQEKLVGVLKGKKREHKILDASGFIAKVEKLIASGVDIKVKEPTKTASKAPIKKTVTKKPTVKKTVGKTAGKTVTKKAAVKKTVTKSTGAAKKKAAIKKRSVSRRKKVLTG